MFSGWAGFTSAHLPLNNLQRQASTFALGGNLTVHVAPCTSVVPPCAPRETRDSHVRCFSLPCWSLWLSVSLSRPLSLSVASPDSGMAVSWCTFPITYWLPAHLLGEACLDVHFSVSEYIHTTPSSSTAPIGCSVSSLSLSLHYGSSVRWHEGPGSIAPLLNFSSGVPPWYHHVAKCHQNPSCAPPSKTYR